MTMKQNIVLAAIKAINRDKGFRFFENLKREEARHCRAGYMSKDGKHSWFWTYNPKTETYRIHIFNGDNGAIYPGQPVMHIGTDLEATERCRRLCESYDRDRTLINATTFSIPKEIPKENMELV